MRVLHIETGRHAYGGPKQVALLLEGLRASHIENSLLVAAGSPLVDSMPADVDVIPVPVSGDLDISLLFAVSRAIKRSKADIVHIHSRRGADGLGLLAAKLSKVPIVLSRRVDNLDARLLIAFKKKSVTKVVAISRAIENILLQQGYPASQLVCIPDAIDTPQVPAENGLLSRQDLAWPTSGPVIAIVAQLIERKGHQVLLKALAQLKADGLKPYLAIFGQGPQEASLKATVERLGLVAQVKFMGFRDDLNRIWPSITLLVHPAQREGLGVAVLEAASHGLPVIAANSGGLPEVIEHEKTGLLVEAEDAPALAAAMARLLTDPALASTLGQAARAHVQTNFSVAAMVNAHIGLYRAILAT